MSDDDDIQYIKRQRTLHYGSLEETERKRQTNAASLAGTTPAATTTAAGTTTTATAGQLEDIESDEDYEETNKKSSSTKGLPPPTAASLANKIDDDYFDLETEMERDKVALLEEFERKKRARQINVSTDDAEIKNNLRQLNEPICYFGEGPAERRRRLKELLASLGENAINKKQSEEEERKTQQREQEATWYHEGPDTLRVARLWIADYSLPRARERLERAKEALEVPSATRAGRMVEMQKKLQSLAPLCSQVGDTRPVSSAAFNEDSTLLMTASWSGLCKLWSVPDCELKQTLRGHASYVGGVALRPGVKADEENVVAMASGGHDGAVKLWGFGNEESIADITGHMPHRVSKVAFHPSGRFLATACYDSSWRLWDLEQKTEVLHQEGHAKPVHCLSYQSDGSVLVTGGLDAFGRVWDLRTGRCIMFLEGHLGAIFGADFSPNGFHIATGSQDNTCKIWDLRRRQPVYTIPAHTNLISDVKYQQDGGSFLVTCSYDSTTKIWSNKTWQPLKTLQGHDNKVISVDVSPNSQYIATTSFDRTFKLWSPDS
ncbi:LOW QUALITY PROTEIN: U4/U6 small nuclear ribonucleoprotein Prp4 [Drosophila sulfurigaster albostrigata]|uniref:LOW QUALITY PROTEIN: U4/U6 small nuclear ribonucleoprotein Prp4 n=1 Tax=Drosophila sulfurigaster albostrigata TaxID=89887 RepID=UPI002D21DB53|nr:LOW QUALITY PROTEIN: U4/U6 small nuclear ribonucleoprotein Prp4 [Drosophila sulfurigaster albostrigata]